MLYLDMYPPYVVEYPVEIIQEIQVPVIVPQVVYPYPTVEYNRRIYVDGNVFEFESRRNRVYLYNGCCQP